MGKYEKLATEIGALVDEKNKAYGNSFSDAGEFLKLLYPDGIPPEKFTDMLCVVRIFDKLKRIATKKDAFGESPYGDIVGYGLLGLFKDRLAKADLESNEETLKDSPTETDTDLCRICGKDTADNENRVSRINDEGEVVFWHNSCAMQELLSE